MLLLKGHKSNHAVYAIAFSPDGASLVSCSRDHTIRLWDLREGKHRIIGTTEDELCYSVAFSPDGRTLAWSNRWRLQLYDVDTTDSTSLSGQGFNLHTLSHVSFSPDGRMVAAARGSVFLWDRETQRLLEEWSSGQNFSLAFRPDGQTLAVGRMFSLPNNGWEYEVVLYDLETRQARATRTTKANVRDLAFAPNGQILAAVCENYLIVWDLTKERPIFQHKSKRRHFQGIAFSPDGSLLAAAHNDRTVRLWRTDGWWEQGVFDWGIGEALCVAFAPDGMTAAAGGRSGRIVLWDIDL